VSFKPHSDALGQLSAPQLTQVQNDGEILSCKRDMKQYIFASIKNHPWKWASCAAFAGFILSRRPARKKRVYHIDSSTQKLVKRRDQGLLVKVLGEVWQFSKPMIAAYLAKLLAEQAKSPESRVN
jgi:hypothetical protein